MSDQSHEVKVGSGLRIVYGVVESASPKTIEVRVIKIDHSGLLAKISAEGNKCRFNFNGTYLGDGVALLLKESYYKNQSGQPSFRRVELT